MQRDSRRRHNGDGARGQFHDERTNGAAQSVSSSNRRTRSVSHSGGRFGSGLRDDDYTTRTVFHRRRINTHCLTHSQQPQQGQQQPSLGRSRRQSRDVDDTRNRNSERNRMADSRRRSNEHSTSHSSRIHAGGSTSKQRTNNGGVSRWPEMTTAIPRHFTSRTLPGARMHRRRQKHHIHRL